VSFFAQVIYGLAVTVETGPHTLQDDLLDVVGKIAYPIVKRAQFSHVRRLIVMYRSIIGEEGEESDAGHAGRECLKIRVLLGVFYSRTQTRRAYVQWSPR
jgi:hypothetical protein